MSKEIAILLPYKEKFTNKDAGAASIWVKDYLKKVNLVIKQLFMGIQLNLKNQLQIILGI